MHEQCLEATLCASSGCTNLDDFGGGADEQSPEIVENQVDRLQQLVRMHVVLPSPSLDTIDGILTFGASDDIEIAIVEGDSSAGIG